MRINKLFLPILMATVAAPFAAASQPKHTVISAAMLRPAAAAVADDMASHLRVELNDGTVHSVAVTEGKVLNFSGNSEGASQMSVDGLNITLQDVASCTFEQGVHNSDVNTGDMTDRHGLQCVSVYLVKGQKLTFKDFGQVSKVLQPDFYDVVDDNAGLVTFKGVSGEYDIYYDPDKKLVYTESPKMNYDDGNAVWVTGSGFGHACVTSATSSAWGLNKPDGCFQMVAVGDNVYEATLRLDDGFRLKFFKSRNWKDEYSTIVVEPVPSTMFVKGYDGTELCGHFTNELLQGEQFTPGVYTIRADYNNKIVYAVGHISDNMIAPVDYKVNGNSFVADASGKATLVATVHFTRNQVVTFENIQHPECLIDPIWFKKQDDGRFLFGGPDDDYYVYYDSENTENIYVTPTKMGWCSPWFVVGCNIGHPKDDGYRQPAAYESPVIGTDSENVSDPRYPKMACVRAEDGLWEVAVYINDSSSRIKILLDANNYATALTLVSPSETFEVIDETGTFGVPCLGYDNVSAADAFRLGPVHNGVEAQYGTYMLRFDDPGKKIYVTRLNSFGNFER